MPKQQLDGQSMVPLFTNKNASFRNYSLTTYGTGYTTITDGRYRLISYPDNTEELYDHRLYPWDWKNLAIDKSLMAIKNKLKKMIPKKMQESLGGRYEQRRGKENKFMQANEKDDPVGEGN